MENGPNPSGSLMLMVSRLQEQMAALSIRNQARKNGMDKITLKEVNALLLLPDVFHVARMLCTCRSLACLLLQPAPMKKISVSKLHPFHIIDFIHSSI